jgi:hypothetical protein
MMCLGAGLCGMFHRSQHQSNAYYAYQQASRFRKVDIKTPTTSGIRNTIFSWLQKCVGQPYFLA